jgi:hypothetical protein
MMIKHLGLSLEELVNSEKTAPEPEKVFYAKLSDVTFLNGLEYEEQKQWELKLFADRDDEKECGTYRVRKTTKDGIVGYSEAIKSKTLSGTTESERPIEEPAFLMIETIAKRGLHKRRYFYKLADHPEVMEIDCFYDQEGNFHPYVKIDIEFKGVGQHLTSDIIPSAFTEVISGDTQEPNQLVRIRELYEQYFLLRK